MFGFGSLLGLSLLGGALIALPFLWPVLFPLTWLAPVPLLAAIEGARDWRQALWAGALAGTATIALGFHWLVYTVHVFGGVNYAVATAAFALFVAYGAVPFVAFAALVRACGPGPLGLLPAAFWVAVEFWYPNLFPWYLATSQNPFTLLVQSADLTGHYGVTFLVLWCGTALYLWLRARRGDGSARATAWPDSPAAAIGRGDRSPRRAARSVAAAVAVLVAALAYGQIRLSQVGEASDRAATLDVAVVQGNISIERKGRNAFVKANQETYKTLSLKNADADVVIWPESAMETWLRENGRRIPPALLPARHPHMIVGAISYERRPDNRFRRYNSAVAVDAAGTVSGRYHKRVLLAFGEYVPLAWLIGWVPGVQAIGDGFTAGEIETALTLPKGARAAPLVCYEDLMPALSRRFVRDQGANLLVNLTNDAWYGDTVAPWQHARLAQWRSIETRRTLVRATNTGLTAVIDPAGRMSEPLPVFTEGVLRATVPLLEMETFYVRYGDWFPWLMTVVTAGAAAAAGAAHGPGRRRETRAQRRRKGY